MAADTSAQDDVTPDTQASSVQNGQSPGTTLEQAQDHLLGLKAMEVLSSLQLNRPKKAGILLEELADTVQELPGSVATSMPFTAMHLARIYTTQERFEEAAALQREMVERAKKEHGEHHVETLMSSENLAATYRRLGRSEEAEEIHQRVLQSVTASAEKDVSTTSPLHLMMVFFLSGAHLEAAARLEEIRLERHQRTLGAHHADTLTSMSQLACIYWGMGRRSDSLELGVKWAEAVDRVLKSGRHP